MLCNLIIPGFPKSGTSSLYTYLNQHQRVQMSSVKEPHFFSVSEIWSNGEEYHNSLFHPDADVEYYGEASTIYCIDQVAIKRISRCLSDVKIIIILREPVERLISHYKWLFSLNLERRDIVTAVDEDGLQFDADTSWSGNYKSYLQFSNYSKYVPTWLEGFPGNCLLIFYEELAEQPDNVLDQCWRFLGLEHHDVSENRIWVNRTKSTLVEQRRSVSMLKRLLPPAIRSMVRNGILGQKLRRLGEVEIPIPEVSIEEKDKIKEMLSEDCSYYEEVRGRFSAG